MKVTLLLVMMAAFQITASQHLNYDQIPALSGIMCQLYLGGIPLCPASSCKEIADTRLWDTRSGLHWLTDGNKLWKAHCLHSIPSSTCLGWMRVGHVQASLGCPEGLEPVTAGGRDLCRKTVDVGCSSVIFPTNGTSYSKVCGLVYGYNQGTADGFERHTYCPDCTIDDPYVEGVSITHGSPRQHIWSLAAGHNIDVCPCSDTGSPPDVPPFVGQDYYCDVEDTDTFADADRLWDKFDCLSGAEACCEEGQWFCKDLPQPTTDDIEFRLCSDQERANEDVYIESVDIYVQ